MSKKARLGVKVGEALPEVAWPSISRIQIACMAGATEDYNPMHLDEYIAKSEGYGGVFANPLFLLALFEQMLERYDPQINVESLNGTFHRLIRPGDFLVGKGRVVQIQPQNDLYQVEVELWAENQRNEVVAKGVATFLHAPPTTTARAQTKVSPKISALLRAKLEAAYGAGVGGKTQPKKDPFASKTSATPSKKPKKTKKRLGQKAKAS